MKESFIYEGKIYISARRASEISEYNSDYIGQLCRSHKLDSRMVGRSWYVTEESIRSHRNLVLEEEVYRNRFENLRRGKNVRTNIAVQHGNASVSASRIGGDNSLSIDIGQMLRSSLVRRSLNAAVAICLILGLFVVASYVVQSGLIGSHDQSVASSASVSNVMQSTLAYIGSGFDSLLGLFGHGKNVALNGNPSSIVTDSGQNNPSSDLSGFNDDATKPEDANFPVGQGMAVVPSSGAAKSDDAAKKNIQDTFSDQVNIHPDLSGTTGVVTPIFKQAKGKGFIYVMVPVKSTSTPL